MRKETSLQYYHNHRKERMAYSKNYHRTHKVELKEYRIKRNLELKKFAINLYGGKCSCCGETTLAFLTLDHINNDGNKDTAGRGNGLYLSLKGKPKRRDLRVQCFNCNCGRQINGGVCPHKEKSL